MKQFAIVAATILLLLVAVFLISRYGWKLGGFNACESTGIEKIEVTKNNVDIEGFDPSSFPSGFIGFYAKQDSGKLHVGFNFSFCFAGLKRVASL